MLPKGHFKELTKEIVADYTGYEPIFEMKEQSKHRMNEIFNDCKGKDVIIATDPDREGYGIGYMVYETIKKYRQKRKARRVSRNNRKRHQKRAR